MSFGNQGPPAYRVTTPSYNEAIPLQLHEQQQETIPLIPQQVTHHSPDTITASDDHSDSKSPGEVSQRHLNLEFDACFHEHKNTKLTKAAHDALGVVHKYIRLFTYHVFVFLIGIPLMLIVAPISGMLAFVYSWIWSPLLRMTIFTFAALLPVITTPLVMIYRPFVDVSARIFSKIAVKANLNGQLYATPPQTV